MDELRFVDICGSGKPEGSGEAPVEQPNNLISVARAKVVDLLCEGPIRGLANGEESIMLNGIPLSTDGDRNFDGVGWAMRYGDADQSAYSRQPSVESTVSVGADVTQAVPVLRTTSSADIDDVDIAVMVPALYTIEEEDGDMVGRTVELMVRVRPDGGAWTEVDTITISGKTNTTYQREYRIEDIDQYGAGPWDIEVSRVTDDHSESNISDKTYWSNYTEIIQERFSMPYSASVWMGINAKRFGGTTPTRSYVLYGLDHVRVPSNMNAQGNYSGTWDGTWQYAWTNDPVWCLMDMLTNERYGRGLPLACIDKWRFYEVSRWCNQRVDDGHGGKRKRFRFNAILQSQEKAYELFNGMASCFFGMPLWSSGMVTLMCDMPRKPGHLATPSNVEDGLFTYSGTGLNARPSVVYVTWNDPDDHYRPAVEVVTDTELLNQYGWNKTDVMASGCTDRHQAVCHGKWILETVKAEKEAVSFKGGAYWVDAVPGEIVAVQDPFYSNVDWGGRCGKGCTVTSIVLDREVTLASGKTYSLTVDLPGGRSLERVVTNSPGKYTTLTIETLAPAAAPVVEAQWILSHTTLTPRQFRVTANVEVERGKYEITGVYHDPTKYDRIWGTGKLKDTNHTGFPTGPIPAVTDLDILSYTHKSGGNYHRGVQVSWEHISDARVVYYDVQWRESGAGWVLFGRTEDTSVEKLRVKPGTYDFRIRGRGVGIGPWYEETGVVIGVPDEPLPAPTNVETLEGGTEYFGRSCIIVWDSVIGLAATPKGRFSHYDVRISSTADSVKRTEEVKANSYKYRWADNLNDFGDTTPARSFKVSVRTVDIYDVASDWTTVTLSNPAPDMTGFSPVMTAFKGGVRVSWLSWSESSDCIKYRIFMDTSNPPTTARGFVAAPGNMKQINMDPTDGGTYYAYVVPYDVFGIGTESEVVSFTAKAVRVSVGVDLVRADGTTVVSEQDLFLDGLCARTITLTTGGEFRSAASGTRFQINKDYIRGLNASSEEQVKLSASTGKLTCGEDEVTIDRSGITLLSPYSPSIADRNIIKWTDADTNRVASIWADRGGIDGGGPHLHLTTANNANMSYITLDAGGNQNKGRIYLKINGNTLVNLHSTSGLLLGHSSYITSIGGSVIVLGATVEAADDESQITLYGSTGPLNGAGIICNGRDHATTPGRLQLRYGGYDSAGDVRFTHLNSAGTSTIKAILDYNANFQI